jgi:hypothetical protein
MAGRFFRLNEAREVIECESAQEWFDNVLSQDRRVAETLVGSYLVSTVFIGLAHPMELGLPLVFETRVHPACAMSDFASSYEEALAVHARMVAELSGG